MKSESALLKAICSCLPKKDFIALHEPNFIGNEWQYVKECIDTGWVSSVGKYVDQFEQKLVEFTGAKFAIATSSGTAALHICYLLAGVEVGDEVLTPTLTFVGTTNAINYCGAIPHFVDTEEKALGINAAVLDEYLSEISEQKNNICINKETQRPIRALCVMHTLGHPVDLDVLEKVCQKYNIAMLEDAAEALGSYYKGEHVGHRGRVGALSFNGNKIITTGGGGAILTNDKQLAKRAKHLTTTAKEPHPWLFQHDEVGYNYRLPNLNAALGCAQLERLPEFLKAKRQLAKKYANAFEDYKEVRVLREPEYAKSNFWLNAIVLNNVSIRDGLIETLGKNNIMTRPIWNLQHTLPMYQHCPRMSLPVAESLQKGILKLPSSTQLAMPVVKEKVAQ